MNVQSYNETIKKETFLNQNLRKLTNEEMKNYIKKPDLSKK